MGPCGSTGKCRIGSRVACSVSVSCSASGNRGKHQERDESLRGFWRATLTGLAIGLQLNLAVCWYPEEAAAILNSPKAILPRTAEVALRRSIPTFNAQVSSVQVLVYISFSFFCDVIRTKGRMCASSTISSLFISSMFE